MKHRGCRRLARRSFTFAATLETVPHSPILFARRLRRRAKRMGVGLSAVLVAASVTIRRASRRHSSNAKVQTDEEEVHLVLVLNERASPASNSAVSNVPWIMCVRRAHRSAGGNSATYHKTARFSRSEAPRSVRCGSWEVNCPDRSRSPSDRPLPQDEWMEDRAES